MILRPKKAAMVPPAKAPPKPSTASPALRSPLAPHKARPLAFKALVMKAARPEMHTAPAKGSALPAVTRKAERERAFEPTPKEPRPKEVDPIDPSARLSAQLAPPLSSTSAPLVAKTEEVTQRSRVSLEELIPQVVRRIAWGGDRAKGAVQIELTSGDRVTVHAEGRRVRVEVEGNAALEEKIASRLRAAGIEVESVR